MSNENAPIIAAKSPAMLDLESGKDYFWCACGRSKNQPFCDGSHAGTGLSPVKFTADKDGKAALCQCKGTANQPFCDGTHARLGALKVGDPAPEPKSDLLQAVPTPEEPTVARIHALARDGLSKLGHHGEMGAMGVPRKDLPHWDDIQILAAQMARKPLLDDVQVGTSVTIGPRAAKPLDLGNGAQAADVQPVTRVVDSTAAGDSFNAGYLSAIVLGRSDMTAMREGHNLASRVIQAPGAIIDF